MQTDDEISKMQDSTKVALAGTGVGLLGAKQITDAKNVGVQAEHRLNFARTQHEANKARLARANREQAQQTTIRDTQRRGTKWVRGGKVRAAAREQVNAQRAHDVSAHTLKLNSKYSTPTELALRAKNMRRMGGTLGVAGTAIAGAGLMRGLRRPAPAYEGPLYKAEVSKTITQARYGGNVEAGRAWRGEDKKDRRAARVAMGAGGVGAAGAGTALMAHGMRPEAPPMDQRKVLYERYQQARASHAGAKAAHGKSSGHLADAIKARKDILNHPEALASRKAAHAATLRPYLRARRAGVGVAAAGGLTALAAGLKAEKDRGTGFGKHKRPRPQVAARRAVESASEPTAKSVEFTPTEQAKMHDMAVRYRQKVGLQKSLKEDLQGNTRRSKQMEDLKDVKRRLRTLPNEDKVALEQEVKGNIRMREGKEDKDSSKKVKRRLKDLPKEEKFALEQDLHSKPIKMRGEKVEKFAPLAALRVASLGRTALKAGKAPVQAGRDLGTMRRAQQASAALGGF